jgi:predicted Zn-dependent protease
MKPRQIRGILILFLIVMAGLSCSTVPVTGRQQLTLLPADQIHSLSFDQYNQFLAEHEVVTGTAEARMVEQVGRRIQQAVETFLKERGRAQLLEGYRWEFNLVRDESANAFAMPGGKVVIFTGILDITQTETGLATVMGHEIAHAIARHGNERMSQGLMAQLGGMALSVALSSEPAQTRQLFMAAYGMGAQVGVLLPYSRLHESEADAIGLTIMAMAGYDPRSAIDFWQRMDAKQDQASPPEFLSTHPSHGTRTENIRNHLPKAMEYYKK